MSNKFLKIKNFIEDIILSVKNKFQSSKYVVKGKCRQCGKCCSNILFSNENGYIKDIETFKEMQKKHFIYNFFYENGKITNEEKELEGVILFKCKHLNKNNKCNIYFIRPFFCRDYPSINPDFIKMGGTTLDDCGFNFAPDKPFSSYLK